MHEMQERLRAAILTGELRAVDWHFAQLMAKLAGPAADPALLLAAALVSQRAGEGHACLELASFAGRALFGETLMAPELAAWRASLAACAVLSEAQRGGPLILDGDRVYLSCYFQDETQLATALRTRARPLPLDEARLARDLQQLFEPTAPSDLQRMAAALAVRQGLAVISGGPGTGKTTTVAKLLILLALQAAPQRLRILLAAPTGKAAVRLTESLKLFKQHTRLDPQLSQMIPEEAATLHRLLRYQPSRNQYGYDARNPLHADVLVVDEASMVDLTMMARLCAALRPDARLILLGDKDQLASVEAGSVLGDICAGFTGYTAVQQSWLQQLTGLPAPAAEDAQPLADSIALLRHSHRFKADSGIGRLTQLINAGDPVPVLRLLREPDLRDVEWLELTGKPQLRQLLLAAAQAHEAVLTAPHPAEALARLNRMRVLCALREGPFGVVEINAAISALVRRQTGQGGPEGRWSIGQPIMVTRNDYSVQLFNGDVGLIWPNAEGHLRAYFQGVDGQLRCLLPSRLPACETVFAMTVHKSQGSEFDQVYLLLPPPNPVITRELVYTAVSRARHRLVLCASEPALTAALMQRTQRDSGLRDRLWRP